VLIRLIQAITTKSASLPLVLAIRLGTASAIVPAWQITPMLVAATTYKLLGERPKFVVSAVVDVILCIDFGFSCCRLITIVEPLDDKRLIDS